MSDADPMSYLCSNASNSNFNHVDRKLKREHGFTPHQHAARNHGDEGWEPKVGEYAVRKCTLGGVIMVTLSSSSTSSSTSSLSTLGTLHLLYWLGVQSDDYIRFTPRSTPTGTVSPIGDGIGKF